MIGIIGVGGVARYAHLPAYRADGLAVSALCDIDMRVCRDVAQEFRIQRVYADPEMLMACPSVSVVDVATPPDSHAALLAAAARHGKPTLIQKPLCTSRPELAAIMSLREEGLRLRLNLTGRHVSAWRKVRDLCREGELGEPLLCTIQNRDWWDRQPSRWEHGIEDFIIYEMVIHHLDLCLFWFGLPKRVTARGGRHSGQRISKTNWAVVTLEYDSGLVVQIVDDWALSEFAFASGHPFEQIVVSGSRGAIRAHSERVEFAENGANAIRTWHLPRPGQSLPGETLTRAWFPASFGAAMVDFLASLHDARAADEDWTHLQDLSELTFAVSDAMRSQHWIDVDGMREQEA